MEKIYRYCFDVVETYHPYKEEIHELLYDMRQNYEEGKRRVDDKIQSGIWQWISEESNEYRVEVNKHQPASYSSIIDAHIKDTHLESLLPKSALRIQGTIIEIQTICFIVCGALTGMRRSELFVSIQIVSKKKKCTVKNTTHFNQNNINFLKVEGKWRNG